MKVKIKKLQISNNEKLPVFLNFILYNKIEYVNENNYAYNSEKINGKEFYNSSDKLISTIIDYSTINEK